jgi:hypothetical protein
MEDGIFINDSSVKPNHCSSELLEIGRRTRRDKRNP